MSQRITSLAWSETALGSLWEWEPELRTAVCLCLASETATCIFWGTEATQIYNDRYADIMRQKHPNFLGRSLFETWPEREDELRSMIALVFRGESIHAEEQPWILDREGELKTYSFSIAMMPILADDGSVLGVFHTARETTDMATARHARRSRELIAVFESMPDAVYVGDINGISSCNREALKMLGASSISDLKARIGELGKRFAVRSIATGEPIPEEELSFARALATGKTVIEDVMATRLDTGEQVYIRGASAPIFEDGEVVGAVAINTDVTDRYTAQRSWKDSQEQLQLALISASLGTWFYDPASEVLRGDLQMTQICGSEVDSGPLEYWLRLVHPDDRKGVQQALNKTLSGGADYDIEYRVVRQDSEVRWVRSRGRLLQSELAGVRMFAIVEDTTARKMTELALRHSERMAETGRLISSIAHEINNPLEAIMNLLYIAKGSESISAALPHIKNAETEFGRLSVIANQTLRFYKQSVAPTSVSCDELLASVLAVHRARINRHSVSIREAHRCRTPVSCFEGEIRQVLSNLIGNAVDSMSPGGGILHLRSREGTWWKTGSACHILTVADTGSGMSAATLDRLFEPFYTTKGADGNGLGLWISHEIIGRHEGSISVRSRKSRGTVFVLHLPREAVIRALGVAVQ